ncbi:protein kinase [Candidatus Uabimicrobium sp. HlEnr_7]|uniref:serine/threonine protein kinase n=1 Tax=Candidatus Uabimicrobium helgolandensis TaxID=3095367 RepID=UPI0035576FFC
MSDSFFDDFLDNTKEERYESELQPGTNIDRYTILSPLGVGGMGVVFKAKEIYSDKLVAIKFVLENRLTSLSKRRFLQEVEVSGQLDHQNIVKVIKAGSFNKHIYLVMEYVSGLTLDCYCQEKSLNCAEKIELFIRICRAMGYAHSQKVIHRDLKPENIMVTNDGQVKIMDFGLAKLTDNESFQLTKSNEVMGSPRYMSPEQAKGDPHIDARTDVYALGAILYELLAKEKMMQGDSFMEILYNIQRGNQPKCLVIDEENTSRALETIWKRSISKKNNRYSDASVFASSLQQYVDTQKYGLLQRLTLRLKPYTKSILSYATVALVFVLFYGLYLLFPEQNAEIRLKINIDVVEDLIKKRLFDSAGELVREIKISSFKNAQRLEVAKLRIKNGKGLYSEVIDSEVIANIGSVADDKVNIYIALELLRACLKMKNLDLCTRYVSILQKDRKRREKEDGRKKKKDKEHKEYEKHIDKILASEALYYFYKKNFVEALSLCMKMKVLNSELGVIVGCSYLGIYEEIIILENKVKNTKLQIKRQNKNLKQKLNNELKEYRRQLKNLFQIGITNVKVAKKLSEEIGSKKVVLNNAYKFLENAANSSNVSLYEGLAKVSIFQHKETGQNLCLRKAEGYLIQAEKLRPQNYEYLILRGQVYSKMKFYDKAFFSFKKALIHSKNDIAVIDAILELPLEDARYQERIFWLLLKSLGSNFKMEKPDLLRADIEKIKLESSVYYNSWYLNRNTKQDIKKQCQAFFGKSEYARKLAFKMLVLGSYRYPLHEIQQYTGSVKRCLQEIAPNKNDNYEYEIRKIYRAHKKSLYYRLANSYLYGYSLPTTEKDQGNLLRDSEQLFLDKEESILIRYLAAKILIRQQDSLLFKHYNNMYDSDLALVASSVLVEEGYLINLHHFINNPISLDTPNKTLLYTRLFRIDNKYHEQFLRNYRRTNTGSLLWYNMHDKLMAREKPQLSKELLAVAGIVWWEADKTKLRNRAQRILQDAMDSKDELLAAYAHHFYWISPYVYREYRLHQNRYYKALKTSLPYSQLHILNANRFFDGITDVEFFNILEHLAVTSTSPVRLKATYILSNKQPYAKHFVRILNHTSLANAQRVLAYISGVVGKLRRMVKGNFNNVSQEIDNIIKLYDQLMYNEDNDAFKSFVYKITAFLGFRTLKKLDKFTYSSPLTANIIMSLCSDPLLPKKLVPFASSIFKVSNDSNRELLKVLSAYESSDSANILRSVAASYSFLGKKNLTKKNSIWKSGFSWGMYRKLRSELMLEDADFYEKITAASTSYYDLYLQKLAYNISRKPKSFRKMNDYVQRLKSALNFAREDVFKATLNYEISFLYSAMYKFFRKNNAKNNQKYLKLAEKHINKGITLLKKHTSLLKNSIPLEDEIRYHLQLAVVKSRISLYEAHSIIEKYLPQMNSVEFLDTAIAALGNHNDEKTKLLYHKILYKKLRILLTSRFIHDADQRKSYDKIAEIHLKLKKVSKYPEFNQSCYEILQRGLKPQKKY